MVALQKPFVSLEQYLEIERAAEVKSEDLSGQMFQMAGGTPTHALLIYNVTLALGDLRAAIMPTGLWTYPDVTIVCGEPRYHPLDKNCLINPTALVQVLSPSTENYDRGEKFAHYRRPASLQEYILVSQDAAHIRHYARQEGGMGGCWRSSSARSLS